MLPLQSYLISAVLLLSMGFAIYGPSTLLSLQVLVNKNFRVLISKVQELSRPAISGTIAGVVALCSNCGAGALRSTLQTLLTH